MVDGPVYGLGTLKIPPAGLPVSAVGIPWQPLALLALTIGNGLMVMTIALEVALEGLEQVAVEVITHVTDCPLVSELVENEALLVPAFVELIFH